MASDDASNSSADPSSHPQTPSPAPQQPSSSLLPTNSTPTGDQLASQVPDSQGDASRPKEKRKGYRKYSTNAATVKFGWRMTAQLYEAMWEAYRDGQRSALQIQMTFGVGKHCAETVVRRGYPKQGWMALKERARIHDQQLQAAQQRSITESALKQSNEWEKTKDENLKYLRAARAATIMLMQKTLDALQTAKFTRTRKTLDKNGNVITTEVPCNAFEMARAAKAQVETADLISKMQSFWLGGPTDRSEINLRQKGLMNITEEQLKYIIETNGQIPADLPEEALLALLGANGESPPGDPSAN